MAIIWKDRVGNGKGTDSYAELTNKPAINGMTLQGGNNEIYIPQNVSDLSDADEYAKKSDIAGTPTREVVTELPITGEPNTIYIIQDPNDPTVYNQYIYQDGEWKDIGTTGGNIDLTNYVKNDELATVAKTGSYNDLSDTPIIVTATDLSDVLAQAKQYTDDELDNYSGGTGVSGDSQTIINTAVQSSKTYVDNLMNNLHAVATSGDYNDLENKPIIPQNVSDLFDANDYAKKSDIANVISRNIVDELPVTGEPNVIYMIADSTDPNVYNQYMYINDGWVNVGDTSSGNIDLSNYVQNTDLDNYLTKSEVATVATTGNYNDLEDLPQIISESDLGSYVQRNELANVSYSGSYNDLSDKPDVITTTTLNDYALNENLAVVATTGDYNDLDNKPNIDIKINEAAQSSKSYIDHAINNLHGVAKSGSYNDLVDKPVIPSAYDDTEITAKVTANENAIANTYTKSQTDDKIAGAINDLSQEHFHVVTTLPDVTNAKENHEYVLVTYAQDGVTIEEEKHYLFYDGRYHSKTVQVNLDGYATEEYVDNTLNNLHSVATTGNYNDLNNKPVIPQNISDFTDASNYSTKDEVLTKTNTTVYTPTSDYHPATKKYVDNKKYSVPTNNCDDDIISDPTAWNGYYFDLFFGNTGDGEAQDTLYKSDNLRYHPQNKVLKVPTIDANIDYSKITNKPSLATVATSGSYSDLSGKPTYMGVMTNNCDNDAKSSPSAWNYNFDLFFGNTNDNTVQNPVYKSDKLMFNPVSGRLTATEISGTHFGTFRVTSTQVTYTATLNLAANGSLIDKTYTFPANATGSHLKPVMLMGWSLSGTGHENVNIAQLELIDRTVKFSAKNISSTAVTVKLTIRYFCLPYAYFGQSNYTG